jgi:hypothetical protein
VDPEKLLESITAIVEGLRADMAGHCEKLDKKYDAIADAMKKKDVDEDDDGDSTMATRTAADGSRVTRAEFEATQAQLRALQTSQPRRRSDADRNLFADMQAKADVAFTALGERADAPMQGEELLDYTVRLHRQLQKHSSKWKSAQLATIARDPSTFAGVCDAIRADALQAGMNPVDLKPFEHREIRTESPGGHKITSFVGRGTIFAQLSRPVRHVKSIGADDRYPRSGGGSVFAAQ